MKVAILGNGPSKTAYVPGAYDLVLGCNFPWCPVDATVIIDTPVVEKLIKQPELIDFPAVYLSTNAYWAVSHKSKRSAAAKTLLNKCTKPHFKYVKWESAGHTAAKFAIESGGTDLWIFGCDSYFQYTVESCTPQNYPKVMQRADYYVPHWRKKWQEIVDKNPSVKFNFVRGTDDYITAVPHDIPPRKKR